MTLDALRPLVQRMPGRVWLSGGVGLDLVLGRVTRPHADIDISVQTQDWAACAASLPPWMRLHAAESGTLREVRPAEPSPPANTWCEDARTGAMVLQINAESGTETEWVYRRDDRISRPWAGAMTIVDGIPVAAPVVQLLWKSRRPEAKDTIDGENHAGRLDAEERSWLAQAIETAHPASPWAGLFPRWDD